jgi:hypothetical protein
VGSQSEALDDATDPEIQDVGDGAARLRPRGAGGAADGGFTGGQHRAGSRGQRRRRRMHEFKLCSDSACTQDSTQGDIVTIHTSDLVKWVWDKSPSDLMPGCPYPVTFDSPGSFNYFCVFHGGAKATTRSHTWTGSSSSQARRSRPV